MIIMVMMYIAMNVLYACALAGAEEREELLGMQGGVGVALFPAILLVKALEDKIDSL